MNKLLQLPGQKLGIDDNVYHTKHHNPFSPLVCKLKHEIHLLCWCCSLPLDKKDNPGGVCVWLLLLILLSALLLLAHINAVLLQVPLHEPPATEQAFLDQALPHTSMFKIRAYPRVPAGSKAFNKECSVSFKNNPWR